MNDVDYMKLAIDLANKTKGQTSPNPNVGSVVVKDGRIIGIGTHLKSGEDHAEVQALNMAGEQAENGTIFVTLEPCSHYGKTPPCAKRIIDEKIKRVVIGTLDPNPLVAGKGKKMLEDAGIEVRVGVLEEEAKLLIESFIKYITTGNPFITVKTAMTLDGKIATRTGSSRWITGEESRNFVHQLRHENDVIMVGIGTVLEDDPLLTVRTEEEGINPIRAVIDTNLRIPITSKIVVDDVASTWIFTTKHAPNSKIKELEKLGVKIIITTGDTKIPLQEVIEYLGKEKITSVLVEGGANLIGGLFDEKLIDKYIGFIAPKLIGGNSSPTCIGGNGIKNMSDAKKLMNCSFKNFGEDICVVGYFDWR